MRKILFVDEDAVRHAAYARRFRSEGFAVETTDSGENALDRIRSGGVDLLVLDLDLDGRKGVGVLRRALGLSPDLPVIIHTAGAEYRNDFSTWSARAFLEKSADLGRLSREIHRLLDEETAERRAA
jgi:DNA-binding NtrC family response regulator